VKEIVNWLNWSDRRCIDHVGENGWRVRVCLDTMQAVIDAESFCERLRGVAARDPAEVLSGQPIYCVQSKGRTWILEPVAKLFVLRLARVEQMGALNCDLSDARSEAVRAIMDEHREIMGWIREVQEKAMKILEEDLSYRRPKVVN
jgi:hypothetical protein